MTCERWQNVNLALLNDPSGTQNWPKHYFQDIMKKKNSIYFHLKTFMLVIYINLTMKENFRKSQMTGLQKGNLAFVNDFPRTLKWSKHQLWDFIKMITKLIQNGLLF